ncbi:MAG: DUF4421 family protein [Flavobacteriales bacterium]
MRAPKTLARLVARHLAYVLGRSGPGGAGGVEFLSRKGRSIASAQRVDRGPDPTTSGVNPARWHAFQQDDLILPFVIRVHLLLLCLCCSGLVVRGQGRSRAQRALDSLYVRDFSSRPTIRAYVSSKFNSLVIQANDPFTDLRYQPNGHYNIGIGASYRRLTLNIGLPMPFVPSDVEEKGRTRYLDAQATLHTNKQSSNLFLQVFKGYHITSHSLEQLGWTQPTSYPYRSDLVQFNIGLSTLRIVDDEHFSYRATFNQDAWQQRTKGSWLYGGYATCYVLNADSALIPSALQEEFRSSSALTRGVLIDLGPMGGYVHTFVYKRHWFLTLSGALGLGPSLQRIEFSDTEGMDTRADIGPGWHAQLRGGIGYNSRYYYAGVLFNQERVAYLFQAQDRYAWDVGNFRVIVAMRLRDRPKQVDRGLRWLKKNTVLPVPDTK